MKLDTSKITDGVDVHCPKKEYVRPLFEAMGWEKRECAEEFWDDYRENTCFRKVHLAPWRCDRKQWYKENCFTIIPFEDLIIHEESKEEESEEEEESNLIKALHAVGVGDWLKEGVEFMFENTKYIFSGSCDDKTHLYAPDRYDTSDVTAKEIEDLFNHPEQKNLSPDGHPKNRKWLKRIVLGLDGWRRTAMCRQAQLGSGKKSLHGKM